MTPRERCEALLGGPLDPSVNVDEWEDANADSGVLWLFQSLWPGRTFVDAFDVFHRGERDRMHWIATYLEAGERRTVAIGCMGHVLLGPADVDGKRELKRRGSELMRLLDSSVFRAAFYSAIAAPFTPGWTVDGTVAALRWIDESFGWNIPATLAAETRVVARKHMARYARRTGVDVLLAPCPDVAVLESAWRYVQGEAHDAGTRLFGFDVLHIIHASSERARRPVI
jgi:hypothetical protein